MARTLLPERPFTTRRLLVGEFTVAEETLRRGVSEVAGRGLFARRPVLLVHPLEMVEDGLSQVEDRVLRELGAGAGARKVLVWVGRELSDDEVRAFVAGP